MLYALRMNSENFGHTTKNTIFRLVKQLIKLNPIEIIGVYESHNVYVALEVGLQDLLSLLLKLIVYM